MTGPAPHLSVTVDTEPAPGLLRPAIEAALAGRAWPGGPEAAIGAEVARAVAETVRARQATARGGLAGEGSW